MSQWPDSMISTQRGSSPKVSHTTAEGTLGHGQRPDARGPSVRERKVSLQAASASPHSSGDRKVSPSSTPVKQMVAAWGARGEREAAESDSNERPLSPKNGDGVKATATIQSDEAEVAAGLPSSAASTAPEASTSEAPADITTTLPRETGNYIQAQIEITPAPEDKQMSTEIPPQSAEAASASAIQPTSETKDTTVRKPQIDAQGTEVKADTSVLTGQLTEPEHKDPPLENEDATTKPAASSEASKSETAQAPNTPTQSNELDKIEAALSKLTPSESQKLQASLDKARSYPSHLPLTRPWCFYWSDTSGANSSKKNSSVKSYTSGMVDLFEADNVPLLCGALKAIKLRGRPQKGDLHLGDYGLHAGGQNIHVFRKGVAPVWEDPWSAKGGRIQVPAQPAMLEAVFERLVLAIVGSAIEQDCGEEGGAILGVVGSRRQRGDRCEIWLGGKTQESAPTEQWIEKVRQRISQEIELPTQKYKQHFA